MRKGREGRKEKRGGEEEGEGGEGGKARVAPLSEILNTPLHVRLWHKTGNRVASWRLKTRILK